SVVGLGGPLNPSTGLITSSGTITSVGGLDIPGPLYLIVHGLPAGVTLANADGTVFSGDPFRTVNVSHLHPGQTLSPVALQFADPGLTPFTYTITVIDGPPGTGLPVGVIATPTATGPGFVANEGQADPQVRFLSQGPGSTLFLTATGAVLAL